MFFHNFKYRFKIIAKDKGTMFWTLLFPILLSTLFFMAFGQLGSQEFLETIDIAIVDTGNDANFVELAKNLSTGESKLFNVSLTTTENALSLLEDDKVEGIIDTKSPLSLTVKRSGISESILKTFIDTYSANITSITRIANEDPTRIERALEILSEDRTFIENLPITKNDPNSIVIYFYSLLAMTTIFGGFLGMTEVNAVQANLSEHAARINFVPFHKLKMFASGVIAAFLMQFIKMTIVLSYLLFVLSIDFGDRFSLIVLTIAICTLLGITFGAFITSLIKGSEGLKTGILIAAGNIGGFLSGMMSVDIKYVIDSNVPIISRVNPASLITDAFFSLYYFHSLDRYLQNMISIVVLIIIFSISTYIVIRRQKYVSI